MLHSLPNQSQNSIVSTQPIFLFSNTIKQNQLPQEIFSKTRFISEKTSNFGVHILGLEPEKIIGLSKINGRSVALLKWRENESLRRKQAINQASYISKWVIEERYPNLLVELFEHGFQKASYQYMEDVWHHF